MVRIFITKLCHRVMNKKVSSDSPRRWGPALPVVWVTRLELAASTSQTLKCRFFPYFIRLFGAFVSKNGAFGCSYKHCFHVVRRRRWSKVWSSPFRWDMDAIRKSKIRLRKNSFSAVIIPYIESIVKYVLPTGKKCGAVGKEKSRRKKPTWHKLTVDD